VAGELIGNYLPLLDISTNETKQQSNTLHIGTHILSKSSKDNTQNPNQTGLFPT
jgi:insecticidal toxin complex protein TccC